MTCAKQGAFLLLILAGLSAAAATTFTWQPTTGGDMADGANWDQGGKLPYEVADGSISITKKQSAPITLSKDMTVENASTKHYLSFDGELKFDTAATTLTLGKNHLYFHGNGCTTRLTRGRLVGQSGVYFESGANPTCFTLSGSDASMSVANGSIVVGSALQHKSFIVEDGATLDAKIVFVGRDMNGGSNNTFKVTGSGSTATVTDHLSVGSAHNNLAEISDGAELSAKEIRVGDWTYNHGQDTTNVFCNGQKLLVDNGTVTVEGGPLTVGYYTCSNALEIVNGGQLTVVSNEFNLGNTTKIALAAKESVPYYYPNLGYRLNGNRVLVSGAGSRLKLDCGSNTGFWLGRGIGDDARVDIEDGGVWESAGEFKIGDGPCTNGVFCVGPGGYFTHSIYSLSIGISKSSGPMTFLVDDGTYACTNIALYVGQYNCGSRFEVKNGGRVLTAGQVLSVSPNETASNNVFAVTSGGYAEFDLTGKGSSNHSICRSGKGGTILVDGGELNASNDTFKAVTSSAGGKGARLIVRNGGVFRMYHCYWADAGADCDCGIQVENGEVYARNGIQIGGSVNTVDARTCWMEVGGTNSLVKLGGALTVGGDTKLNFSIPAAGYCRTPVQVKTLTLGTVKEEGPKMTLKVSVDEKFPGGTVTLAETTNDITYNLGFQADLPAGATLITSDPKKLQVKFPRKGLMLLFR